MKKNILLILLLFASVNMLAQHSFKPDELYRKNASKAYQYYQEKKYLQSGFAYDSLLQHSEGLTADQYNAACSWALAGDINKAFSYLNTAVNIGKWTNLSHLQSDKDLYNLHADKRWQTIIKLVQLNKDEAEKNHNKPLIAILDTILHADQTDRTNLDTVQKQYGWQSKQIDSLWRKIKLQDSINLVKIKNIIDAYGWPEADKVGEKGANTIFLVIQHADSLTQVTYLPLLRQAVRLNKARPQSLALLEDRILTKQGKEQIYGSQLRKVGSEKTKFFPIKDEANVNKRRAEVGLEPIEDYARRFGIDYIFPPIDPQK